MLSYKNKFKYTGDYSKYDQTIPSVVMFASFDIIRSRLNLSSYEETLWNELISYITHGHIYHPLVGHIKRSRGIISGSAFTNLIDGIANIFMIKYSSEKIGVEFDDIKVCGDDNLMITNREIDYNKLTSYLNTTFNVVNTIVADDVAFPNVDYLGSFLGSK